MQSVKKHSNKLVLHWSIILFKKLQPSYIFGIIIIIIILVLVLMQKPTTSGTRVQNILTKEYHKGYTVQLYNGKVDLVYVDTNIYNVYEITQTKECDSYEDNDEGHNCVLWDTISIYRFLSKMG